MTFSELIARACDADMTYRPIIPAWMLASREYDIADIAELLESVRIARN
jgi:hypothetical protein